MLLLLWKTYILLQLLAFGPPHARALGNTSARVPSTNLQPAPLMEGAGSAGTLPCEASGMCSLGKVQPFTGKRLVWSSVCFREACCTACCSAMPPPDGQPSAVQASSIKA